MPRVARLRLVVVVTASMLALAACAKKEEAAPASAAPAPAPVAESPPPAPKVVNARAFTIGELYAFSLRDGTLEFPNDNKIFGVGHTPEDVAALLSAAGQPTDNIHLDLDPLLVKDAERVMLFDTGAGSNFGPSAGQLPQSLQEAGVDAQSVTDIFISHVHGDHVGGILNAEGALTFPNAKIHIERASRRRQRNASPMCLAATTRSPSSWAVSLLSPSFCSGFASHSPRRFTE